MNAVSRRSALKAGLAGAALAAPAVASAQQTFNWKMTSAYGKGAPFYMDGPGSATDLAKRIDAMSGGRLKIQVFGAGELVPAFEALFAREGRQWPRFYDAVRQLAKQPETQRHQSLRALSPPKESPGA